MTKGERDELAKILKARSRLAGRVAEQRAAALLADAEEQLAKMYKYDDAVSASLTTPAHAAVRHPEALETFRRAIINGSTRAWRLEAMAEGQDDKPDSRSATGQFAQGHSGNPGGRPKGSPNLLSAAVLKARAQEFLSRPEYLEKLKARFDAGQAQAIEVLFYHYGWGRPKEVIKIEEQARRPFMIVLPGYGRDPLLEVEAEVIDQPERKLPSLPGVMLEVDFTLQDLVEEQP